MNSSTTDQSSSKKLNIPMSGQKTSINTKNLAQTGSRSTLPKVATGRDENSVDPINRDSKTSAGVARNLVSDLN